MPATTPPDAASAPPATPQQIGPYQVIAKIGEGGMGEVYRARDARLNREVAIKVLPRAFADDPLRMARFEREAQLLASLNHPKIAAIYGLEESGSTRALVMELVDGPTLAERIGRTSSSARPKAASASPAQAAAAGSGAKASAGSGAKKGERTASAGGARKSAIPVDEALPIAYQIAEALEYAHEHGVIHRDLKPANIKVTADGDVKVLDFGLAKALGPDENSGDISNSPTLSLAMTEAGMIIGTAAYMSPEQAKGKSVDRRADIWAFGCVFYEMLTAQKAFEGETVSDVLAAVIMKDPDWSALPETIPLSMQRLIRRCLQKDPKQRLQAIGDARIAIEETLSDSSAISGAFPETGEGRGERDRSKLSPLRRALPWAVAVACFMLGAFLAFVYFRPGAAPAPAIRSFIAAPEKMQFAFLSPNGAPVLSPDGSRLVFPAYDASGDESLWLRPLDSLTAQRLQGTEDATFPFWAPDSRQLGFFQNGKLFKIDVTGGPPVLICDAPNGRGGTWNLDGEIVFAPTPTGGISNVPAAGGTPTTIISNSSKAGSELPSDRWPDFLPDGKHFLYLGGDLSAPETTKLGIYIGTLGSKEARFLLQADSDALYAAPGYLLFLRGDTLMAQRFNAGRLTVEGDAFPVAENVPSPRLYRLGIFGISQTGLLVYSTDESGSGGYGQLVWLDAKGNEIGKAGPGAGAKPRLSPDGKTLAYASAPPAGISDIWLMDETRGVQTRFTFGPGLSAYPVWSPDGSRIAYGSGIGAPTSILVKDASGASKAEQLLESTGLRFPTDWSRDDRYILFSTRNLQGTNPHLDIWALPLLGDRKPFPYLQTPFDKGGAVFSPDGRWVAYESNESGKRIGGNEVYISTFPAGGGKWQVSQDGGEEPEWSRDGKAVYYLGPGGKMMETSITERGPAIEIGAPVELFQASAATVNGAGYAVSPDGKHFLMVEAAQAEAKPLTLVTNWAAGLEK